MHRADQRHGLDVVAALRADGQTNPDLLLAGLLHDCGKGRATARVAPRRLVARRALRRAGGALLLRLPGFRAAIRDIAAHAARSAELAACGRLLRGDG